ncbi:MAG: hypothetical protein JNJ48_04190 [Phycisphaerae bacterium]|nr:hypothetical protein [Phycisphaerae bacterium]
MVRSALAVTALLCAAGASYGQLYNNGPIVTHPGGMTGAAAGADRSAISPTGGTFGYGSAAGNRLADDFLSDASWQITSISFFVYTTGATAPTVTAATLRIWDAAPNAGGNIIWGDATTNVLTSVAFTNIYRTTGTDTAGTTRRIQEVVINMPNLVLGAGTFWLDWSFTGGSFVPPVSSTVAPVGGNALQFLNSSQAWNPLAEATAGVTLPFIIYGVPSPSAAAGLGLIGLVGLRRRR